MIDRHRCVDQLMQILELLGLPALAVPLCHLQHVLAEMVLNSSALAAAAHLKLAALAEMLVLPDVTARAEKQAAQVYKGDCSQHQKVWKTTCHSTAFCYVEFGRDLRHIVFSW